MHMLCKVIACYCLIHVPLLCPCYLYCQGNVTLVTFDVATLHVRMCSVMIALYDCCSVASEASKETLSGVRGL